MRQFETAWKNLTHKPFRCVQHVNSIAESHRRMLRMVDERKVSVMEEGRIKDKIVLGIIGWWRPGEGDTEYAALLPTDGIDVHMATIILGLPASATASVKMFVSRS